MSTDKQSETTTTQNPSLNVTSPLSISPTLTVTPSNKIQPAIYGLIPYFLPGYHASPARTFTESEIAQKRNYSSRIQVVNKVIAHPIGAVVEYPEWGTTPKDSVAHIFSVDPQRFIHPKDNVQYSWATHGEENGRCYLLHNNGPRPGKYVDCKLYRARCAGIRSCEFYGAPDPQVTLGGSQDAVQQVFMKTLAFFCALQTNGCLFDVEHTEIEDLELLADGETTSNFYEVLSDIHCHSNSGSRCKGKLLFKWDSSGKAYIECEKRSAGHKAHLILWTLNEFNLEYLQALFNNDISSILRFETAARDCGYGLLVPCMYIAAPHEQKTFCYAVLAYWHRRGNGTLKHGTLQKPQRCNAQFIFYKPWNLDICPKVVLVIHGQHSHSNPRPAKTPKTIAMILHALLESLNWRLADATPRRVLLDAGFMAGLCDVLQWKGGIDPSLIDLHPSLANADHAKCIINSLRDKRYPDGTGFEAALKLLEQHQKLPPDKAYVRVVERHIIPGEGEFLLVVCMFKSMSELLARTNWPTIDTSFKRVWGWQEFEMEAWFPEYGRSVVVARTFTNSQSGKAHFILFERIFDIMKQDTGIEVRFRHIHGEGIDMVTADQHKGQALGLGKFCQKLCRDRPGYCAYNHTRPLHELSPYEHLARFYRLCFQHYSTKVHDLRGHVSENVCAAMMSLASAEPLADLPGTLDLIRRQGGKKGNDWLNDKLAAEGFALAGICRQRSLIPVESWKAAPNTTNGNEQAHRDANRDGVHLSLFAGIMRILQYDS
ncbi:hypothetical protein M422DRAFT_269448 [Sphaerobolus stellatus SS14]|uniref:Uncharacterized protein n=1 Tax=Sphaerobolus stellatus (strain SS14) TaxID=990650 RepID=A0A0C9UV36_SPHS4|nr:hypothetical protein M422DRAFT_269448 [Sphaerobolus stellatus SS14]